MAIETDTANYWVLLKKRDKVVIVSSTVVVVFPLIPLAAHRQIGGFVDIYKGTTDTICCISANNFREELTPPVMYLVCFLDTLFNQQK